MSDRILVHVSAMDPMSLAGLHHTLRHRPELQLLTDADTDTDTDVPEVALIAVEQLDDDALKILHKAHQFGRRRIVLIVSRVDDNMLLAAVEAGVCGVVPRSEATAERLVHAVQSAATGDATLPPDLLGRLLAQVARLQRHVLEPHGLSRTGLSARETEILRLIADGYSSREIAEKLAYSERTVKNTLHDITTRFQLRNRSQAVAYALREGLI
ncbi:LuxR C-terminal-related transcriptional regulator [Kribbella sp. CA-253562]|uniref:LuxR C-terminal-related transcriptional regulator n=1 Tax=Kribbella sp. CA-253562 TaxID=3239942 RepID=UPI003D8B7C06